MLNCGFFLRLAPGLLQGFRFGLTLGPEPVLQRGTCLGPVLSKRLGFRPRFGLQLDLGLGLFHRRGVSFGLLFGFGPESLYGLCRFGLETLKFRSLGRKSFFDFRSDFGFRLGPLLRLDPGRCFGFGFRLSPGSCLRLCPGLLLGLRPRFGLGVQLLLSL